MQICSLLLKIAINFKSGHLKCLGIFNSHQIWGDFGQDATGIHYTNHHLFKRLLHPLFMQNVQLRELGKQRWVTIKIKRKDALRFWASFQTSPTQTAPLFLLIYAIILTPNFNPRSWSTPRCFVLPLVAPALWKTIPPEIRSAPTLITFQKSLRTWLFYLAWGCHGCQSLFLYVSMVLFLF